MTETSSPPWRSEKQVQILREASVRALELTLESQEWYARRGSKAKRAEHRDKAAMVREELARRFGEGGEAHAD